MTNKITTNNTAVSTIGTTTTVTLYGTKIVEFTPEKITLKTGGFKTATTKKRMNEVSNVFGLGYRIFSKRGQWVVDFDGRELDLIGADTASGYMTIDRLGWQKRFDAACEYARENSEYVFDIIKEVAEELLETEPETITNYMIERDNNEDPTPTRQGVGAFNLCK